MNSYNNWNQIRLNSQGTFVFLIKPALSFKDGDVFLCHFVAQMALFLKPLCFKNGAAFRLCNFCFKNYNVLNATLFQSWHCIFM